MRRRPARRVLDTAPPSRPPAYYPPFLFIGGAEPFDPARVSGLVARYTAGPEWCFTDAAGLDPAADTEAFRLWHDRSPTAAHLTQATAAKRPVLTLTGGRYYARTTDADDLIVNTTFAEVAGEWTIFVVHFSFAVQNSMCPMQIGGPFDGISFTYRSTLTQANLIYNEVADHLFTCENPQTAHRLWQARRQADGTLDVWADGIKRLDAVAGGNPGGPTAGISVGHQRGDITANCLVGEFLVYDNPVSEDDRLYLQAGLQAAWGVT